MGAHKAELLRNHGIVAAGESLEEAVVFAILLEKAARVQLLAGDGGISATASSELARKVEQIYHQKNILDFFAYFTRRVSASSYLPHE